MIVDPSVVPGLLFLLAELVALVGVGYVILAGSSGTSKAAGVGSLRNRLDAAHLFVDLI